MVKSIIILLLLGAIAAGICSVIANLIRAEEIRELRKELRRFDKAFRDLAPTKKEEPVVTLVVKDETKSDDLPKFGDF